MPVHQFVHDAHLQERACATTGATTHRLLRARRTTYSCTATPASRCRSSRRWSARCTRRASRSSSTSSTTTPPKATTSGPTLSFRGIDNAAYYRLVGRRPQYYMDYTGTGNTPQRAQPALAAADHGLAALLGHRDARRRLPLRPRRRRWPASSRRRPALGVLRLIQQDPVVSPGEAHRRAVGRRRGRLPGRQLPAAVDGVERQVPRHRARLLARRAGRRWPSSPPA